MSKQAVNDPSPDNTSDLKNSPSDAYDKGARRMAYVSIFISMAVILFGDNLMGRLVGSINKYWPWFLTSVNGLEGSIAILNVLLAAYVLWDPKTRQAIKYADNTSVLATTKDSFQNLMLGWRLLWLVRMILYLWLSAHWFGLHNFVPSKITWSVAAALHLLVGFFYYFLFFVLDPPSVTTKLKPDSAIVFQRSVRTVLALGTIVFIASVLVSAYHPRLPSEGGLTDILVYKLVPTYTGIGLAFFIGRLDSHYLRMPRVILAPMYLYVIVQPLWGRVEETDFQKVIPERAAIFGLVLILKFVFFYAIAKWIRNGGFLHYLIQIEGDRNK